MRATRSFRMNRRPSARSTAWPRLAEESPTTTGATSRGRPAGQRPDAGCRRCREHDRIPQKPIGRATSRSASSCRSSILTTSGSFPNAWERAGFKLAEFGDLGIDLPPNYEDDLSTKPSIQKAARTAYDKAAPLDTAELRRQYVNF